MNNTFIIFLIVFCCFSKTHSQEGGLSEGTDLSINGWIDELYDPGVQIKEDSVYISDEVRRVISDSIYRAKIYPKEYSWQIALSLVQNNQLKKAFWHFINLYPKSETNKKLVMKSILAYEQELEMDRVIVNAFYTYCFMDPEIGVIKDESPEILAPHILEAKLRIVDEIVRTIVASRK